MTVVPQYCLSLWPLMNKKGYTLIELISVMVLLGILSAIFFSKTVNSGMSNILVTEGEILKQNLRYAQIKSMNSIASDIWQITFSNDGKRYSIHQYKAATALWQNQVLPNSATDADGDGVMESHQLPSPLTKISGPSSVLFNNWGVPVLADRITPAAANQRITLGDGTHFREVTVTRNTGYIP